jgi:hypothetical protein
MSFVDLKGFSSIGENLPDDHLRANIVSFFDYGFLNKGNFHNIRIPTSGQYGGSKHKLELTKDPRYTAGQVWQGHRANWVWQSGVTGSPVQISGVNVNGTFYPSSTSGAYSHYIDYPNGRVIFNSAISQTATVTAEYSHKYANIVDANQFSFYRQLQEGSLRVDSANFTNPTSGNWATLPENRLQLPVVAVEVTTAKSLRPYAIGGGQWLDTKVIFHVLAENDKQASKLAMAITMQNDKTINTFNVQSISQNNKSPLDYKGSKVDGCLTHPQMTDLYPSAKISFSRMNSPQGQWLNSVYYVPVTCTAEMVVCNI